MVPEAEEGAGKVGRRPSRDKRRPSRARRRLSRDGRRLVLGLAFMAALLATTLASAFLVGRAGPGATVAAGVPLLVVCGWILVLGAAVVFYRTYAGPGAEPTAEPAPPPGDEPAGTREAGGTHDTGGTREAGGTREGADADRDRPS